MCDYSLHAVKTRPAEIADRLVTTKFAKSATRGFGATEAPDVAVCLRPGTELVFERNVRYENFIDLLPRRSTRWNTARFCQIELDNSCTHHDALEFPDGQIILLTRLCPGQHATVLQLPLGPQKAHEQLHEQTHAAPERAREVSPA